MGPIGPPALGQSIYSGQQVLVPNVTISIDSVSPVFTYHSQREPSGPDTQVSTFSAKQHSVSAIGVGARPAAASRSVATLYPAC